MFPDQAAISLDVESGNYVWRPRGELIKDKTVIIIAHRMRTVMDADKIIVIDKGKVVKSGIPANLAQEDGILRQR